MSAKLSTDVTDLVRDGRYVLSAYETDGAFVASSFLDATRPHLEEGDEEPRPDAFLVALSRQLRASLDRLVATDFKVAEIAGQESILRAQHKEDKRQLGFLIVALRRIVLGHYVDPDTDNLGLQPLNVRDSMTVVRRAELIAERFEAVELAKLLGKSRFDEPLELGPYVDEIRTKARELLALADQVNEAHRETDRARRERSEAKKVFKRLYLRSSRVFEDLCRLAGHDEIAARVRKNRPTRSPEKPVHDGDVIDRAATSKDSRDDERLQEPAGRKEEEVPRQAQDARADVTVPRGGPADVDGSAMPTQESGTCQPPGRYATGSCCQPGWTSSTARRKGSSAGSILTTD